jgi:DICT domain-containing protein
MNESLIPEMLNSAVMVVIIPILGIIAKYIVAFLKSRLTELEHRIHNDTLSKYMNIAEDAIATAVISVNQTFVDTMKKQGTFDQAAMEKSFVLAKNKALAIMGASAQNVLEDAYDDIDAWLDSKIEFYVNQNKK